MMVIYLPVKFEFDWTNRFQVRNGNFDGFRVRIQKRKCGWTDEQTDVGHINLIGRLVTCNPSKNSFFT